jgi:SlyX protein
MSAPAQPSDPPVPHSPDTRFEALEMKLAYLERSNQELGDVIYRQQQELDALKARMEQLVDQLRAAADGPPEYAPADEKPPHY